MQSSPTLLGGRTFKSQIQFSRVWEKFRDGVKSSQGGFGRKIAFSCLCLLCPFSTRILVSILIRPLMLRCCSVILRGRRWRTHELILKRRTNANEGETFRVKLNASRRSGRGRLDARAEGGCERVDLEKGMREGEEECDRANMRGEICPVS